MSDFALYRCKGCGETDTTAEISLVPRAVVIRPDGEYLSRGWADEAYWEAETIIGYGCMNEKCEFWQGNYGSTGDQEGVDVQLAHKLEDIAEVTIEMPT